MTPVFNDLVLALEATQTSKVVDSGHLEAVASTALASCVSPHVLEPNAVQRVVPALCSWLRAHEHSSEVNIIHLVLQMLGRVLGLDKASDGIAVQKGMLSTTTALLERHSSDPAIVRSCLDVLVTLSVVENADAILSRLGCISIIVDLLRKYRDDAPMLEDAVTTLAVMAKRTRHRRALSQDDNITVLVDVLKRGAGHPSLVVAVCRFLRNFAVKEECCLTVVQNGGIDALMAAFNNSIQKQRPLSGGVQSAAEAALDTRAAVAAAVWTCSMECAAVQDTLLSSGWLSSLAAVLQAAPEHAGMHEAALGIVRSLSRNKQYREDILGLGFVEEAIHSMRTFGDNPLLMKEGCGFVGNLATDPDTRVLLGESGVVVVLVDALASCRTYDDRKVAKMALGALSNLASCDQNREILSKTKIVPVLLDVARCFMTNENILEYAVGALSHLAVHPESNRQLIQAGAIEALLLFLGDHREDLQVVAKCVLALRRIYKHAFEPEMAASYNCLAKQVAGAGNSQGFKGIHLLVEALQEHVYDETVVKETALLLTGLSRVPANVPPLMQVAVKPCMKALEVHVNEVDVSDALAGFMGSLPLEEDEKWDESSGLGGGCGGLHLEDLSPKHLQKQPV